MGAPNRIIIDDPDEDLYREWKRHCATFDHSKEALRELLENKAGEPGGRNFQ